MNRAIRSGMGLAFLFAAWCPVALAEGGWRLELSGGTALDSSNLDRSGDLLITGYLDYEIPTTSHTTLIIRTMPLFVYEQQDTLESWWNELVSERDIDYDDLVWGAGAGLAGRLYSKADEHQGFFLELEALAFVHTGEIEGDDSSIDFLTGVGLGYQFRSNWQALVRVEHISNAGLGDLNAGVNAVKLGLGYRF